MPDLTHKTRFEKFLDNRFFKWLVTPFRAIQSWISDQLKSLRSKKKTTQQEAAQQEETLIKQNGSTIIPDADSVESQVTPNILAPIPDTVIQPIPDVPVLSSDELKYKERLAELKSLLEQKEAIYKKLKLSDPCLASYQAALQDYSNELTYCAQRNHMHQIKHDYEGCFRSFEEHRLGVTLGSRSLYPAWSTEKLNKKIMKLDNLIAEAKKVDLLSLGYKAKKKDINLNKENLLLKDLNIRTQKAFKLIDSVRELAADEEVSLETYDALLYAVHVLERQLNMVYTSIEYKTQDILSFRKELVQTKEKWIDDSISKLEKLITNVSSEKAKVLQGQKLR